jgi:hypothetical protein
MSLITQYSKSFVLKEGKQFRNVCGSTTQGTIGKGDLLPDKYYSWTKVYETITGTDLGDTFICPACKTEKQTTQAVGGHIVLGPNSYRGRADANIDLTTAGNFMTPYSRMPKDRDWQVSFIRKPLLPNVNRVFLVPLCKTCNNQGSSVDLTMKINCDIAQLICYGYTNNFEVYYRYYETWFFTTHTGRFLIEDNEENHAKLYEKMEHFFQSVVSGWVNSIRSIDPTDQNYINASPLAQPSVPSIISF